MNVVKINCRVSCNNHINENKKIEANSNLIKRQAPIPFCYMLPYFKVIIYSFFLPVLLYMLDYI